MEKLCEEMDEGILKRCYGAMGERTDGNLDGCLDGGMGGGTDGTLGECMDGGMRGGNDGKMGERLDEWTA